MFIGDVDEIWDPVVIGVLPQQAQKLKLLVYTYYLNNRSTEDFWGTIIAFYSQIKDVCLNHVRTRAHKIDGVAGWHFTSMAPELRRKLTDSYTDETYASPAVMDNLDENVKNSRDFLGRNFTYKIDESDWPPWLKEHREDYKNLIKEQ